jgi:hypothetical protein
LEMLSCHLSLFLHNYRFDHTRDHLSQFQDLSSKATNPLTSETPARYPLLWLTCFS